MVPVAPNTEALKLLGLLADPFHGDFAAALPDFSAGRGELLFAELFGDQDFNRQTVVVPPRHEGRVVAFHGPELGDNIF